MFELHQNNFHVIYYSLCDNSYENWIWVSVYIRTRKRYSCIGRYRRHATYSLLLVAYTRIYTWVCTLYNCTYTQKTEFVELRLMFVVKLWFKSRTSGTNRNYIEFCGARDQCCQQWSETFRIVDWYWFCVAICKVFIFS